MQPKCRRNLERLKALCDRKPIAIAANAARGSTDAALADGAIIYGGDSPGRGVKREAEGAAEGDARRELFSL